MPYYVGDKPVEDIVVEPLRAQEDPDYLERFDDVEIVLRDFNGAGVTAAFTGEIQTTEGVVLVAWPEESVLTQEGLYSLYLTLTNIDGSREQLPPLYIVVQQNGEWATLDALRAEWPDAPSDDYRLFTLLWLARQQVEEYGTTLSGPPAVMARRAAQMMQTRNLWNAGKVDPASGGMGEDSFVLTTFPLDWMIRQILRPKSGVPRIG